LLAAWDAGYMAVMDCVVDSVDIPPCPYTPGSLEADRWECGIAAAWEDECPVEYFHA
jgi:hypothetical protein